MPTDTPTPPLDLHALQQEETHLQDRLIRVREEGDHEQVSVLQARLSEVCGILDREMCRTVPW